MSNEKENRIVTCSSRYENGKLVEVCITKDGEVPEWKHDREGVRQYPIPITDEETEYRRSIVEAWINGEAIEAYKLRNAFAYLYNWLTDSV